MSWGPRAPLPSRALLVLSLLVACGARSELVLPTASTGESAPALDGGPSDADLLDSSDDVPVLDAPDDATLPGDAAFECGAPCAPPIATPRPIAPLSTSTVTTPEPQFRWAIADGTDGAEVDVCRDRACTQILLTFVAAGENGVPPMPLPIGLLYWRLRGTRSGMVGAPSGTVWEFVVGARSAAINTAWGTFLDFNGDGYADVAVGAFAPGSPGRTSDNAYVYTGGPSGLSASPLILSAPGAANTNFQPAVASAGDVNGDGFADLVFGSGSVALFGGAGSASVYLGSASGLSTAPIALPNPTGSQHFGLGVASAGDVNGDGYADVVVISGLDGNAVGGAYLVLGGAGGPSTTPIALDSPAGNDAPFASSIASAGDVNGDGYGDVIVGNGGTTDPNLRASLYLGGPDGLSTPTAIKPAGPVFGPIVAGAGDVNGDGLADVLIGTPFVDAGQGPSSAYVYLGSADGVFGPFATLTEPSVQFAQTLGGAGDVNQDGYGDIVVAGESPEVWLYLGSPDGPSSTPVILQDPAGGPGSAAFGSALAGAGDINGDGFPDVLVGNANAYSATGDMYVFWGDTSGSMAMPTVLKGPGNGVEFFGWSVARAGHLAGRQRLRR